MIPEPCCEESRAHATALRAAEERAAALERERAGWEEVAETHLAVIVDRDAKLAAAQAKLAAVLDLADAAVRDAADQPKIALRNLAQRLRAEAVGTGAEAEGGTR